MVNIKSVAKSNPQDPNAENKYYAKAVATGEVDLERLAYLVSNQCTVRESDCYAVLFALQHNIMDELKQGKIVRLGTIGSFQVGVSSTAAEKSEDVGIQTVASAHLNYRPSKRMRDMLEVVKFKVVSS
ncbi:MAG: DNA-binding protein [Bacteroidetes bacterium]|jgi:predicted histone-like DNA-binding protein|nr:DNA-binding protein [Bacteroidota bacterium]